MYLGLKILITVISILCIFFTFIGIYALDFSLICIAGLLAISILLLVLESKKLLKNPFKKQ